MRKLVLIVTAGLFAGEGLAETRGNLTDFARPDARDEESATLQTAKAPQRPKPKRTSIQTWRTGLYTRAQREGIDPRSFAAVINVTGRDKRPNFPKSPYSLVLTGRWMHFEYAALIDEISKKYQVDKSILLGIWGIETHYGRNMGDDPLGRAMVKYAREGKTDFAENQLLSAMLLVKAGEVDADSLVGSFAGALGHTQFIPSSYVAYAVDGDGDGDRDLWTVADALASTANYLKEHGWRYGEPWGIEVILPRGFHGPLDKAAPRTGYYWNSLGVRLKDGRKLPFDAQAPIIKVGRKYYLIYHNFGVIRRYNHSDQYVVDVGELGDLVTWQSPYARLASASRFGGAPTQTTRKNADDGETSNAPKAINQDMLNIQTQLKRAGYYQGVLDGIAGPQTSRALGHFQRVNKLRITGRLDDATRTALSRY